MSGRYRIAHSLHTMTPAPPLAVVPKIKFTTEDGIMEAYGTTVPVDTTAGYAPMCLFWTATKLYANTGSVTSSLFKEIAPGFVGDITGDVTGDVTGDLNSTSVGGSITSGAPSAAELVAILGAAGTAGRVRTIVADAGTGSGESYLCVDNGTVWSYTQLTDSA